MKDWTLFLPSVQPEVAACPPPIAIQAIRDTAIDFCAESKIWQEVQPAYFLTPGLVSYPLEADAGTRVYQIVEAQVAGRELGVLTPETCDRLFHGWRLGLAGTPEAVTQMQPEEFCVLPQPTVTTQLILTVILGPTRDSTQGPDFLFNDYYDALCSGAKARLLLMRGTIWADPQQGLAYAAVAANAITRARERRTSVFGQGSKA